MENLIKEKVLGKGSFGAVYLVRRKTDQQLYALKQVQLSKADFSDRNRALNQVRILASIRHPNILRFKESFMNSDNTILSIVTEYAAKGDLSMKIQTQKKNNMRIPEDDIWKALHDVAKGLSYLHSHGILHRDIKPANILESFDGYKIADLNTSKVVESLSPLQHTLVGTPFYACPQTWRDEEYGDKCDIWSLGVTIYEMAALKLPFPAQNKEQLYKRIIDSYPSPLSDCYSDFLKKLIMSMLSKNMFDRPTAAQILEYCEMYEKVKKETSQNLKNQYLLDTIILEEETVDWKTSLPSSRFSPAQRPLVRKNQFYKNKENSIESERSYIGSHSKNRENRSVCQLKPLPPKNPNQTPPITRKNSVRQQRELNREGNRNRTRLPSIATDRSTHKINMMR